jgi:hypothetical protein
MLPLRVGLVPRQLVQLPELAQLSIRMVALLGRGEGDDAVWCPIVWSDDGGCGVLANERQLCEVVVLVSNEYVYGVVSRTWDPTFSSSCSE